MQTLQRHRLRRGSGWAEFERLASIETDDCVIWPYGSTFGGYGEVTIQGEKRRVTRLALERRETPPTLKHHAAHGPCHNPRCMNYRHLSWKTRAENMADKARDGTAIRGERCHLSKLTDDDVRAIRQSAGTQEAIASQFNISQSTVSRIRHRLIWHHVPSDHPTVKVVPSCSL